MLPMVWVTATVVIFAHI